MDSPQWKLIFDSCLAAVYFIIFIITIIFATLKWKKDGFQFKSLTTFFYLCLFVFLALRISWQILDRVFGNEDLLAFIINRCAWIFFLFAYNNTLFFWIETIESTMNVLFTLQVIKGELNYRYMSNKMKTGLWITTGVITVFTVVCVILYAALGEKKEKKGELVYDINILGFASLFLLYSLGYLIYGIRIYRRLNNKVEFKGNSSMALVAVTPIVSSFCFFYRFCFLLYRPITGKLMPYALYMSSYFVPEVIPSLLFLYTFHRPFSHTLKPTATPEGRPLITPVKEMKSQSPWGKKKSQGNIQV